mgnify:CR=1 FL=1
MISTKVNSLEAALPLVKAMDCVADVRIWTPDDDEVAEYKACGIEAKPQLEVVAWRFCRNSSHVKWAIEALGMICVGEGSTGHGQCYSFQLSKP